MQTYLYYFSKTCSLTFFVLSFDIHLFRNFHLNPNPSPDRRVEPLCLINFSDLSQKNDNALSLTLDIFIKLPSLKAFCPTTYFIQFFFFLHCKPSFVRFCKSLHSCCHISQFQSIVFSLYN